MGGKRDRWSRKGRGAALAAGGRGTVTRLGTGGVAASIPWAPGEINLWVALVAHGSLLIIMVIWDVTVAFFLFL